jgi:hypothetical protein
VTQNLLAAFGAGPAGKVHASTANWQSTPTGIATPSPSAGSPTGPAAPHKASRKKR